MIIYTYESSYNIDEEYNYDKLLTENFILNQEGVITNNILKPTGNAIINLATKAGKFGSSISQKVSDFIISRYGVKVKFGLIYSAIDTLQKLLDDSTKNSKLLAVAKSVINNIKENCVSYTDVLNKTLGLSAGMQNAGVFSVTREDKKLSDIMTGIFSGTPVHVYVFESKLADIYTFPGSIKFNDPNIKWFMAMGIISSNCLFGIILSMMFSGVNFIKIGVGKSFKIVLNSAATIIKDFSLKIISSSASSSVAVVDTDYETNISTPIIPKNSTIKTNIPEISIYVSSYIINNLYGMTIKGAKLKENNSTQSIIRTRDGGYRVDEKYYAIIAILLHQCAINLKFSSYYIDYIRTNCLPQSLLNFMYRVKELGLNNINVNLRPALGPLFTLMGGCICSLFFRRYKNRPKVDYKADRFVAVMGYGKELEAAFTKMVELKQKGFFKDKSFNILDKILGSIVSIIDIGFNSLKDLFGNNFFITNSNKKRLEHLDALNKESENNTYIVKYNDKYVLHSEMDLEAPDDVEAHEKQVREIHAGATDRAKRRIQAAHTTVSSLYKKDRTIDEVKRDIKATREMLRSDRLTEKGKARAEQDLQNLSNELIALQNAPKKRRRR